MIDVFYDMEKVSFAKSDNTLERFFDLLPVEDGANIVTNIKPTSCVLAKSLGKLLKLNRLYLKNETELPTGTTKDRMATVVLPFLRECGVKEFCTSSTGNSSTSLAYYISYYPDMKVHLFSGEDFKHRVHYADKDQVKHYVMKDATFVEAYKYAGEFAKKHQLTSEQGFFNPSRREGLKTVFFEAAEQIPTPIDWYVQAISSAMGVYGVYKGAKELVALNKIPHVPKLLCIQQESCAPMVNAYEAGSDVIRPGDVVAKPLGIASAILRGDPSRVYPYVKHDVVESKGTFLKVTEAEIRETRTMVAEMEGMDICFTSAAAIAGLAKLARKGGIDADETIMVNITGSDRSNLTPSQNIEWVNN